MDVNTRMVKVNVALIVLLLLFVAVVAIRAVTDSDTEWTYDKVFDDPGTGQLSDVTATDGDDIWVAGNATRPAGDSDDDAAADGFLLHYDGDNWQRRPMPSAFGDSVYEARFDAVDSGGFLLTASLENLNAPRTARWDGTRWTALPGLPDGHRATDVRAFAEDDIWILGDEGTAHHWNGTRWTVTQLPVTAVALDGRAPDDLWAVGHQNVDENSTRGPELTQPAAAHWDGRTWRPVRMPDYHFPAPSPPEAQALLTDVVARAKDDVRVYGEHTYNHGEQHPEPADADIRLRWEGTRWRKLPDAEGPCADRGRAIRDGERGKVLGAGHYLTADGDCRGIGRAELPSTDGVRSDSKQSLRLNAITAVPGTDKIIGIGSVKVSQGSGSLSRSVIVALKH
ncbi:hypothetical protein ACWGII_07995 [Streptomyces sp. NPDC054855]